MNSLLNLECELIPQEFRRVSFASSRRWLRAMIPAGACGVYMLLCDKKVFYVGRSDRCVLTRLLNHDLLTRATHVAWEPCPNPERAFWLEAAWFHHFIDYPDVVNINHPARPAHRPSTCPFCFSDHLAALRYAIPHLGEVGGN